MKGSFMERVQQYAKAAKAYAMGKQIVSVGVIPESQDHVLRWKMKEAGFTHDQKALVDLTSIRIENVMDKPTIFFCPQDTVEVKEHLHSGDGGDIPYGVKVNNLEVPKNTALGIYHLRNVILHSNGVMSITGTPETKWERAIPYLP